MPGKRGNPNLKKGGPPLNPNGRTKGSKNKLTLMQNGLIDQFAGEMNKEFKAVIRTVKAVEHYGAQDGNNIVINIKGLEDINLNNDESIDAEYEEIDDGVQSKSMQ